MQPVELDVGGNLDPTQNLWLHMVERDFEAGDGGGHVANLRHSHSLAQGNVRHREPQAKQSCVREDVLSAGCESPPRGAIPREAESNCVVNERGGGTCASASGDGVESNWKRMRSP